MDSDAIGSSISYKLRRPIILLAIFCPIILLATFAVILKCSAFCADYATSLSMLVHGVLGQTSNDSGIIYLNSTSSGILTAFDYENLEFYSGDNFSKLSNVIDMFAFASKNEMIGDMIFLYNYLAYNGYHEPMSMTMDSEFAGDVLEYMQTGVINVDYTYIINKTTDATLASFYTDLSKSEYSSIPQVTEEQGIFCDSRHRPRMTACKSLFQLLNGTHIATTARSYCQYGCCVSLRRNASFT
ncbi:hypothetical protein V1517DRAFT_60145 [Lipomyces orientalis]|uniref:Uncharacterized protein n=1 Tax=Lipomyces orientalis TaxID=1233043 RepID=A0ACC3TDH1_9ASCO